MPAKDQSDRVRAANPVAIRPPEWISLDRAFSHIHACLDSRTLAARDLYNGLLAGDLPSAIRAFDKSGMEVKTGPLDPEHWQQYDFVESNMLGGWVLVPNTDASRRAEAFYSEVYYFVGAAALQRLYRSAASPETIQSTPRSESAGFPSREYSASGFQDVPSERQEENKYRLKEIRPTRPSDAKAWDFISQHPDVLKNSNSIPEIAIKMARRGLSKIGHSTIGRALINTRPQKARAKKANLANSDE